MRRRRRRDEEEPTAAGTTDGSSVVSEAVASSDETQKRVDSTTDESNSQEQKQMEVDGKQKGRHFGYVVYPSEEWVKANCPDCEYDGLDGWGTAPDDWQVQLQNTGLMFVVSPLHDRDTVWDSSNNKMRTKKPHWHVIVSWGNTTTYQSASSLCDILKCPKPLMLRSVTGAYRYLQHKDNPEKAQYKEPPKCVNGWERPLEKNEVNAILSELERCVYLTDCVEYGELVIEAGKLGSEYWQVAMEHTLFLVNVCRSYRCNPIRCLSRFADTLPNGDEKQMILDRKKEIEREIKAASNNQSK